MKRIIIFITVLILALCSTSFAKDLSIIDLIDEYKMFNGSEVVIQGEVIGNLMERKDGAWFNIMDNSGNIGVWVSKEVAIPIKFLGRHSTVGDIVKVSGVFYADCPMHAGETDIHANEISVIRPGYKRILTYDENKINIIESLVGLLICLYIIKILKKKRSKSLS